MKTFYYESIICLNYMAYPLSNHSSFSKGYTSATHGLIQEFNLYCFRIAVTVGLNRTGDEEHTVNEKSLRELYDAFIAAMLDYTIDNRGDVGAWWVELILLRVVALRNVLLLVKKINKLKSAALLK